MKLDKLILKFLRKNKDLVLAFWRQVERKKEGHALLLTKTSYKSLLMRTKRWCKNRETEPEGVTVTPGAL